MINRPAMLAQRNLEWVVRIVVPVLLSGVIYGAFWIASLFDQPPGLSLPGFVIFCGMAFVVAEGVRAISVALNRRVTARSRGLRRALLQIILSTVFGVLFLEAIYVPLKLLQIAQGSNDQIAWAHVLLAAAIALFLTVPISALQLVLDFYKSSKSANLVADQLREATLRAQLEALKAQINPHFLFNSLNALYGLIDEDPARARRLVVELSDVFRYVLTHASGDLVALSSELQFLDAYCALLVARHGTGFSLERDTGGNESQVALPPMTLQLLVENAVKHNRVDPGDPLTVCITRDGDMLQISNVLKPKRTTTIGSGTGLANIDQRYRLLNAPAIKVRREANQFVVRIALLPCSP